MTDEEGNRREGQDPWVEDLSAGFERGADSETADTVNLSSELSVDEIPQQKSGALRLFLALLLVVAVAGAGFYLLGKIIYTPPSEVLTMVSPSSVKMKVPVRPNLPELTDGVKEEIVAMDQVVTVAEAPVVAAPQKNEDVGQVVPVAESIFRLESPSYLYPSEVKRVVRQLQTLGYKIERTTKPEAHEMTRLLVGLYIKSVAQQRLADVKKNAAGAFWVAEEGKYSVYAGSFLSLDKARRQADLLFQKGVHTKETQVKVDLPRTTLHFGRFETRQEALKSVKALKKLSIKDVSIVASK